MTNSLSSIATEESVLERDDGLFGDSLGALPRPDICAAAVVGLLLGVASVLALLDLVLLFVPIAAVIVSIMALARIRALAPHLMGRRLALVGLALGLIFGLAGAMQPSIERRSLEYWALETAKEWFVALRNNEPELAHQLMKVKWMRQGDQIPLRKLYTGERARSDLEAFVTEDAVRLILANGKASHIRFREHVSLKSDSLAEQDDVVDVYEVTVPKATGMRETFLIEVTATRQLDLMRRLRSWKISTVKLLDGEPPSKSADDSAA
jgi:hypothetical protein